MATSVHARGIRAGVVLPGLVVCQLAIGCDSNPGAGPEQMGALAVTSAVPNTGPTESAVEVKIYGRGFEAGATVAFGGVIANTVVVNAGVITTMAPPHPEGAVDVVVTNPGGTSAMLSGGYTYVPVALTSVAPRAGFTGSELRLMGTGFLPGALVTLDGNQASNVRVISPVAISAVAPVHDQGMVDVVVMNPGGQAGILRGAFFYSTVSLSATPSSVMPGGQLSVSWTTPASESSLDWIGLYRVGASNFDDVDYKYTSGAISGTHTFLSPGLAGQYEFRYFPNDGWTDVARSNTVTVVGTAVVSDGIQTTSRRSGRGGAARTRGR